MNVTKLKNTLKNPTKLVVLAAHLNLGAAATLGFWACGNPLAINQLYGPSRIYRPTSGLQVLQSEGNSTPYSGNNSKHFHSSNLCKYNADSSNMLPDPKLA